jgi:hypothetical protein
MGQRTVGAPLMLHAFAVSASIGGRIGLPRKEDMVPGKQSSPVDAVRAIFDALEPLDEATRARAIASAMSLLGMSVPATRVAPSEQRVVVGPATKADTAPPVTPRLERPQSLIELVQEKNPVTNPQRIAVFAFYRERVQGLPRFSRRDLEDYFADARLPPPANYDRDFNAAVQQGWIHEAGEQSYLTTKGIEAVEAGFAGRRTPTPRTGSRKKATKRRTRTKSAAKRPAQKRKSVTRKGSTTPRRR